MKTLLLSFMLLPCICFSQNKNNGYYIKQGSVIITSMSAGFFHRRAEIRRDDYRRYSAVHTNANPNWANPRISFKNKYNDWPIDKSSAYFGSKTFLVWTTDGYHNDNFLSMLSMSTSIGFSLSLYDKPNFKDIVIQCLLTWLGYSTGRSIAHNIYPYVD